jgi:hypothetical protein
MSGALLLELTSLALPIQEVIHQKRKGLQLNFFGFLNPSPPNAFTELYIKPDRQGLYWRWGMESQCAQ